MAKRGDDIESRAGVAKILEAYSFGEDLERITEMLEKHGERYGLYRLKVHLAETANPSFVETAVRRARERCRLANSRAEARAAAQSHFHLALDYAKDDDGLHQVRSAFCLSGLELVDQRHLAAVS